MRDRLSAGFGLCGLAGSGYEIGQRAKRNLCNPRTFVPSFMLAVRAQGIEGVAETCFRSHGAWPPMVGPERVSAEPRKALFFAEQKNVPKWGFESLPYLFCK
jgi:hypothetical protein